MPQGWGTHLEKLPGVVAPFDPDTSYVDEVIGYVLAAAGLLWQLSTSFGLPFPLNLVLLP